MKISHSIKDNLEKIINQKFLDYLIVSLSEKQLREWTATYSVDERGSVLDGLFAFVSGIFAKKEEKASSSSSSSNTPDVAQVICNPIDMLHNNNFDNSNQLMIHCFYSRSPVIETYCVNCCLGGEDCVFRSGKD